jgi:hypothetical protein
MIGIDHNRRIQAQLHAAAENKAIDDMERNARPLFIVLAVCLLAIVSDVLLDIYSTHQHAAQIQAASAFASCLNGQQIEVGDSWASCKITKITLVEGIK